MIFSPSFFFVHSNFQNYNYNGKRVSQLFPWNRKQDTLSFQRSCLRVLCKNCHAIHPFKVAVTEADELCLIAKKNCFFFFPIYKYSFFFFFRNAPTQWVHELLSPVCVFSRLEDRSQHLKKSRLKFSTSEYPTSTRHLYLQGRYLDEPLAQVLPSCHLTNEPVVFAKCFLRCYPKPWSVLKKWWPSRVDWGDWEGQGE